ncbi:TRAP transporter small permease [Aquibium sp. A9E412]|uniref:TRAP transporter small permease n=1 Tax=Aquibium sp. A9E412 TaxID=2976767 RepID=UPI0025AFC6E6|nr:TRAP transporter small permease subunit [Aquibium sp. A9E412]MDN2568509.1 TRAP transporter small permease [Aquibium sp. A9E412]
MTPLAGIRRFAQLAAMLGLAALVILSVMMMLDIAGRELFGTPITGFSDISDLIIVIAAAACFPASLATNQHVAVRFAGLSHWRVGALLDLLGHLVMLAVFVLIAWQLSIYTLDVFRSGQTTWLIYIPVWPVWTLTTALFVLCVPVQIASVVAALRALRAPAASAASERQGDGV